MRSSNGGLAYGTNGNPQTHIMQETYATKGRALNQCSRHIKANEG